MDVLPIRPTDAALSAPALLTPTDKPNFAGLDALRCFAALGVVLLHSCVPYLRYPMPGLSWSVSDSPHTAIDILFWSIELFIMPLFLVLAGFFAWQTLQRRGPKVLFRGRARRLLVPLLFGAIVILPLDLYCWVGSWVAEGIVSPVKLKSLKLDHPLGEHLWGLSHLWFLQYLFLYITCLALFAMAAKRYPWIKEYQPGLRTSLGLTLAAATVILCIEPQVVWGFQHSFFPSPSQVALQRIIFHTRLDSCHPRSQTSLGEPAVNASDWAGSDHQFYRSVIGSLATRSVGKYFCSITAGRREFGRCIACNDDSDRCIAGHAVTDRHFGKKDIDHSNFDSLSGSGFVLDLHCASSHSGIDSSGPEAAPARGKSAAQDFPVICDSLLSFGADLRRPCTTKQAGTVTGLPMESAHPQRGGFWSETNPVTQSG